jgi:hypothetical protein
VVAFVEKRDVQVEDIAILQDSLIRYTVADDFVDGSAE